MATNGHPKIVPIILEHLEKETEQEIPFQLIRGNYRASEVGDCPRYLAYKQFGREREKPGPELKLLFEMGHTVEHGLVQLLRRSGMTVTNSQHVGIKTYEKDGIRINITASIDFLLDGKYIVDAKSTNFFTAKLLTKPYILNKYRGYYDQLQTYLNIIEHPNISEWGCLLFQEKMTSRIIEFWFKRDKEYFENKLIPRLLKVEGMVQQKKIPIRPYTKSSTECERCSMRKHCWGVAMKRRTW